MACLLKAPDGSSRGCVVFTTQERDHVVFPDPATRAQVESLKQRYVIGLHHNWHDHAFRYDPLFDFSLAGDSDLIEASGKEFPRIPMDACNFAPPCYSAPRLAPFWDILYVARAVNFKGIPEFFAAIRALYDRGLNPRVLFICPLPVPVEIPGIPDVRAYFEAMFTLAEQQRVVFLTLDWGYPFPFDAETLAFFYRSSRIFFHSAPNERRCRTAAYAWAGGMAVVGNEHVASILPRQFHRPPFLFAFGSPEEAPAVLAAALAGWPQAEPEWAGVAAEFSAEPSARRLAVEFEKLAADWGWGALSPDPVNASRLDIRLGRHHGISLGANRVPLSLAQLCDALSTMPDQTLRALCRADDPELALCDAYPEAAVQDAPTGSPVAQKTPAPALSAIFRKLFRA